MPRIRERSAASGRPCSVAIPFVGIMPPDTFWRGLKLGAAATAVARAERVKVAVPLWAATVINYPTAVRDARSRKWALDGSGPVVDMRRYVRS
ncbi:hypothetical protein AAFF_G00139900 [Aldrovandia affinis]|uniref:Uncharacterized protein n=1 Tax=Aldrovandia affinis TaxID=143900 RepID=A0AAD7TDM8_9TELE|nr:hypothetical protein AAFF_G00139900 [Aldrovandia affinis]